MHVFFLIKLSMHLLEAHSQFSRLYSQLHRRDVVCQFHLHITIQLDLGYTWERGLGHLSRDRKWSSRGLCVFIVALSNSSHQMYHPSLHVFLSFGCEVYSSVISAPALEINNMNNIHPASHYKIEAKVKHLTQLMSTVMNQISPPKQNNLIVHVSTCLLSNDNHEAELMNFARKTDDQEIKMTKDEVKSKIQALQNQIKQIKKKNKTNTRRSVCFPDYVCIQVLNIL